MENTCFLYLFVIDFCTITPSFIESWAGPVVVVAIEVVVQVAVLAIHIPHVVLAIRRTELKACTPFRTLRVFPIFFKLCALRHITLRKFWQNQNLRGRCHFFQKFAPSL